MRKLFTISGKFCLTTFFLAMLIASHSAIGQKKTTHQEQAWLGYMTSTRINDKYAFWFDAHLVPESFGVLRTGLTRNLFPGATGTAGYAFVWLSMGENNRLQRHEYRPWAQFQYTSTSANGWGLTNRVRYDSRFKENIEDGQITDGFAFNHRMRFMTSLRKTFRLPERTSQPYVVLANEVLLNYGRAAGLNTFDQNRLSLSVGVQKNQTQYQVGLMNRFVQTGASTFTLNHTLVIWVFQKFDFRRNTEKRPSGANKSATARG